MNQNSLIKQWKRNTTLPLLLVCLFVLAYTPPIKAMELKNSETNPTILAQQQITGTVTDGNGQVLPGASVVVVGTTNGTQTDFDGNYAISADSNAILQFSYVGFKSQEIPVDGRSTVDVSLTEDTSQLDEVVVVGYSSQTRGDLSGSVSSVDVSEATKAPIVNAAEALQGRVSGVSVTGDGQPGSSPIVRVRGFGTSNSNNPLYIIDGVQTLDPSILNSINPADIDQMNVLKDGAAAIYGARASNGVVIITTKTGGYTMEGAKISLDTYTGFSRVNNLIDLLNPTQHGQMIFESLRNDGVAVTHPQYGSGPEPVVPSTLQGAPFPVNVPEGGTDWMNEIFRSAPTQNVSLSVENGNESGKYLMSIGYINRDGIQKYTGFKRVSSRLNLEFKLLDKLTLGQHFNASFSNTRPGWGAATYDAFRSSPLVPVRDSEGNYAGTYAPALGLGNSTNPVAEMDRASDNYRKSLRLFGDVYAQLNLADGLNFKTTFGGDFQSFKSRTFTALNPEHGEARTTNQLSEQNYDRTEWVWTNTLNFNKSYGKHSINALLGVESLRQDYKASQMSRTGYLFEDQDYYLLSNGAGDPIVNSANELSSSLYSYFTSVNYSYDSRYYLTATLRRDKSSRFEGDNQSDIFPSFSAAWNISNESFYPEDAIVNSLKLRGSWGQLGNQELPANNPTINISSLDQQYADYAFSGSGTPVTGARLTQVGNSDLRWETSETVNVGLDVGLFNNLLNLTFEAYQIETKDLITRDNSLISTTAIDAQAPLVNLGSFKNTGFDFTAAIQNQTESGFFYGVNANLSVYKNEVTDLISEFQLGNSSYRTGAITRTQVGQPLSSFYGRIVDGIFSSESEVANSADQGFDNPADGVGRFRYRDINEDGVINDEDRTFIGKPHPDFTYGLNLQLGYKGFDMSAFFQGVQGIDVYNYEKMFLDFPTFFNNNRSVRVMDSWRPDNQDASLPALSQSIGNSETNPNTYFVEDGSFLRLKNLQIGYTLPKKLLDKLNLDTLRIYVQGTNLVTWTKYAGFDPEVRPRINADGSLDNLTIGVDDQVYPIAQVYTLGVNVKL